MNINELRLFSQADNIAEHLSEDELTKIITWYVSECKRTNTYMKNFSTFLNNLPDINEIEKNVNEPKKIEMMEYHVFGSPPRYCSMENWPKFYEQNKEQFTHYRKVFRCKN